MPCGHKFAQEYIRDESGSATVWSLFWTLIFLFLAGLAIDTSNAYRFRAALQATADASSVGAIMGFMNERTYVNFSGDTNTQTQDYRGTSVATALASHNMTASRNGTVVPSGNVEFGRYSGGTFVAGDTPINAARVRAIRTGNNSNELPTLLLDRFGLLSSWDVGATSVAQAYLRGCPGREHIMAGNILQIASNNDFTGDLCMHGENAVDLNNGNEFFANLDGEVPGISFGLDGAMCSGFGNCQTEGFTNVIPGNINLTESMIQPGALTMPDVAGMIGDVERVLNNPSLYTGESDGYNQLIPPNLVTNPDRALGTAAILEGPNNGATLPPGWSGSFSGPIQIVENISATAFAAVVNSGTPLPNNTIYNVTGGCDTGNRRLELEGASVVLQDIVIRTSCRVMFDDNITFQASTIFTTYDGASSAIHGSAGVQLGGGTCADGSLGSHLISAVQDIDFAAGLSINNSHIISGADVDIAAQPNGMEGASILAANDIRLTSNGEWQGCPRNDDANRLEAYAYRIVE